VQVWSGKGRNHIGSDEIDANGIEAGPMLEVKLYFFVEFFSDRIIAPLTSDYNRNAHSFASIAPLRGAGVTGLQNSPVKHDREGAAASAAPYANVCISRGLFA
jgi:hypothetical protein